MRHLTALLFLTSVAYSAVPEKWLDGIAYVESGNRNVTGDSGRAVGIFQLWEVCWRDISAIRASKGLPVYDYKLASNPAIARSYVSTWLSHLEGKLTLALGRKPSLGELYACYNLGYGGFKARGYKLEACPAITVRAVAKLTAYVRA